MSAVSRQLLREAGEHPAHFVDLGIELTISFVTVAPTSTTSPPSVVEPFSLAYIFARWFFRTC